MTAPTLPTNGYIRPKRLAELLGVSEATIWRKAKNGTLPRPIKLSDRVTAFDAVEINAWIKSRKDAA
ncbi:AlpA family phage regulatory protein [Serratia marcescens]|uniref:helix-turn-helix transcriptional regulator n=1 Tax=Serratia marcescens TaxID=615 RepID=UPI0030CE5640